MKQALQVMRMTAHVRFDGIEDVINSLGYGSIILFKMFADKDNYHVISDSENITINVNGNIKEKSTCENLLSVNTDYKLKINEHLTVFKKTGRKANALSRILSYINFEKRRTLINSLFTSQFNYCSLWMIPSRAINNKINCLRERCLCIV